MAKQNKSADKSENKASKSGFRRHNRSNNRGTVSQDRAASPPKFSEMGNAQTLKHQNGNVIVRGQFNRWESLNAKHPTPAAPVVPTANIFDILGEV
jgi:hypothetical protein